MKAKQNKKIVEIKHYKIVLISTKLGTRKIFITIF